MTTSGRRPNCSKCGAVVPDPVLIFSKAGISVSLVCLDCAEEIAGYPEEGAEQ